MILLHLPAGVVVALGDDDAGHEFFHGLNSQGIILEFLSICMMDGHLVISSRVRSQFFKHEFVVVSNMGNLLHGVS